MANFHTLYEFVVIFSDIAYSEVSDLLFDGLLCTTYVFGVREAEKERAQISGMDSV